MSVSGGEKAQRDPADVAPGAEVGDPTRPIPVSTSTLKIVADGVNRMRAPDRSFVVITHHQRLLSTGRLPDAVHVLSGGPIRSGGLTGVELECQTAMLTSSARPL